MAPQPFATTKSAAAATANNHKEAQEEEQNEKNDNIPEYCFLQVSIAASPPQTIVIQLFVEKCPNTCRNFLALCCGTAASSQERTSRQSPQPTYRASEFHRIIDGFMVQGGDFERFDGTGGYSPIYPGGVFQDESFAVKHSHAGIVSMANAGKNTNKSQFFITLKSTPHLDGKHVAFGQVVEGMNAVTDMLTVERQGDRPVPLQRVIITDCGVGRGGVDDDVVVQRKSKKKSKKRSKHHGRTYTQGSNSSDEEDDSVSSGSSVGDRRKRHDRKRKKQSRSQHHGSSSSSSSSGDEESDSSQAEQKRKKRKKHERHEKSDRKHEKKKKKKKKKFRDKTPRR
jgi:peptidyl-prolyl isomerase G (cyclophilin G)